MFSKMLIVGAVLLAFVTVGWLTVQRGTVTPPSAVPMTNVVTDANPVAPVQTDAQNTASPSASALAGVVYLHDSVTNKWYAYHYSSVSGGGPVIDDGIEIAGDPFPVIYTSGWVNYQDQLTTKWYSVHYSITPSGPVIDESIEIAGDLAAIQAPPRDYAELKEAQLSRVDARIGAATYSIQVPTIDGCKLDRNVTDC